MEVDNQSNASSSSMIDGENKFINLLLVNGELRETTFKKTIACYFIMGIIFFIMSVVAFSYLDHVKFIEKLYYDPLTDCNSCCKKRDKVCEIDFTLDEDIKPPIYVMYRVGNFYQNHKK